MKQDQLDFCITEIKNENLENEILSNLNLFDEAINLEELEERFEMANIDASTCMIVP